jgi:formate/nitrite transporter FocA (FNT family)
MSYKTPKNVLLTIIKVGIAKGEMSVPIMAVSGVMAGVYVGFGALLALIVASGLGIEDGSLGKLSPSLVKLIFGMLFPIALLLIVFTGVELFTGNTMYMTAAMLGKKTTFVKLIRNWVVVYLANFAGCALMAYFGTYLCEFLYKSPYNMLIVNIGYFKVTQNWGVILLKAIFANWLVNLGIWFALASESFEGWSSLRSAVHAHHVQASCSACGGPSW